MQADLGFRCLHTESLDTVVYVNGQKMPRLDCIDVHADLDLCCPQKGPFFLHCASHKMNRNMNKCVFWVNAAVKI